MSNIYKNREDSIMGSHVSNIHLKKIIPSHPAVSNPHTPTNTPTKSKFLTVIDVCSAFFSIPVDEVNQYFFVLTWRKKNSPGQ